MSEEFSVMWVGEEAHILDIEFDAVGLSNLSLGAMNGLVDAGFLKQIQSINQGWQYGFTTKAFDLFKVNPVTSKSDEHTYRGYKIAIKRLNPTKGTFEAWLVTAYDKSILEVEVLLKITDFYIAGSPLIIAQAGGLDDFAETLGIEYIHGLIDVANYQRGEQKEFVVGSWFENNQNNLQSTPDSKKIRNTLLSALKRAKDRNIGSYRIQRTDIKGMSVVLGISANEILRVADALIYEGFIATHSQIHEDLQVGAFYITLSGEKALAGNTLDSTDEVDPKLGRLSERLVDLFDIDEMKQLCLNVGLKHDTMPHDNTIALSLELIKRVREKEKVEQLIAECRRLRPNEDWSFLNANR